jgi:hypothetical protein
LALRLAWTSGLAWAFGHAWAFGLAWATSFQVGQNGGEYGDQIPAVWVNKAGYFHVCSAVSGNHNHWKNLDYQVNQWIHFEIKQEENSNGEVIYSIKCDGVTVHEVVSVVTLNQKDLEKLFST